MLTKGPAWKRAKRNETAWLQRFADLMAECPGTIVMYPSPHGISFGHPISYAEMDEEAEQSAGMSSRVLEDRTFVPPPTLENQRNVANVKMPHLRICPRN